MRQSQTLSRCIKRTHSQERRIRNIRRVGQDFGGHCVEYGQMSSRAKCPGPLFGRPGHSICQCVFARNRRNRERAREAKLGRGVPKRSLGTSGPRRLSRRVSPAGVKSRDARHAKNVWVTILIRLVACTLISVGIMLLVAGVFSFRRERGACARRGAGGCIRSGAAGRQSTEVCRLTLQLQSPSRQPPRLNLL